ncbi:MAG: nuclear transport factor 2 family protein [Candidatus ainarchaeum sp.]|nr:nuclear transport factor 2 family protein [Candidatus ainarchaeum sp.]
MNMLQLKNIMTKYGVAWEKKDVNLILDCFAVNGVYQENPLSKPYNGHGQIKKFWENIVVKKTNDIHFTLGECHIAKDSKTGFAQWDCVNTFDGKRNKMVGIMIIRMKKDKIVYLNEYWNQELI